MKLMKLILLLLVIASALPAQTRQKRSVTDAEARKVHAAAIVFDTHNDFPMATVDGVSFTERRADGHTDLPRMKEGGVSAQIFAAYVASSYEKGNRSAHRALEMIDTIKRDIAAKAPQDTVFVTTAAGVVAAKKQGKLAVMIGIEGGHAIQDSVRLLRDFYDLGVRYMTLTHTNTNGWADAEGDAANPAVKHHNGLTALGRDVVREMNRLGMMVDISHVADKTFWDALETSRAPVFASHSSCRALASATRNMTDEMIVAMAKRGGVININFSCDFLSQRSFDTSPIRQPGVRQKLTEIMSAISDPAERRAKIREITAGMQMERATLADVVAHINHVVKLAGVDAVGVGSDYDGVGCTPIGLDDVSKLPNLTKALLEEGYTAAEVHKMLGGNMVRYLRAVEVAAGK